MSPKKVKPDRYLFFSEIEKNIATPTTLKPILEKRLKILHCEPQVCYNAQTRELAGSWGDTRYNNIFPIFETVELTLQHYGVEKFSLNRSFEPHIAMFYIGGINPEKNFLIAGRESTPDEKIIKPVKICLYNVIAYGVTHISRINNQAESKPSTI